jgi:hypothetical protein
MPVTRRSRFKHVVVISILEMVFHFNVKMFELLGKIGNSYKYENYVVKVFFKRLISNLFSMSLSSVC